MIRTFEFVDSTASSPLSKVSWWDTAWEKTSNERRTRIVVRVEPLGDDDTEHSVPLFLILPFLIFSRRFWNKRIILVYGGAMSRARSDWIYWINCFHLLLFEIIVCYSCRHYNNTDGIVLAAGSCSPLLSDIQTGLLFKPLKSLKKDLLLALD
jgi:hypothetical protein